MGPGPQCVISPDLLSARNKSSLCSPGYNTEVGAWISGRLLGQGHGSQGRPRQGAHGSCTGRALGLPLRHKRRRPLYPVRNHSTEPSDHSRRSFPSLAQRAPEPELANQSRQPQLQTHPAPTHQIRAAFAWGTECRRGAEWGAGGWEAAQALAGLAPSSRG